MLPQVFEMMRSSDLEFIGMINPADWRWQSLFPREMPRHFREFLTNATAEQNLHAYELVHPVNRLLDVWCGASGRPPEYLEINEWTEAMWQSATIHLHPILRTEAFFHAIDQAISELRSDPDIQKLHGAHLDALAVLLCLRFLWQRPCKFLELVTYWCDHKPRLEAYRKVSTILGGVTKSIGKLSDRQAFDELRFLLSELVIDQMVMLEK